MNNATPAFGPFAPILKIEERSRVEQAILGAKSSLKLASTIKSENEKTVNIIIASFLKFSNLYDAATLPTRAGIGTTRIWIPCPSERRREVSGEPERVKEAVEATINKIVSIDFACCSENSTNGILSVSKTSSILKEISKNSNSERIVVRFSDFALDHAQDLMLSLVNDNVEIPRFRVEPILNCGSVLGKMRKAPLGWSGVADLESLREILNATADRVLKPEEDGVNIKIEVMGCTRLITFEDNIFAFPDSYVPITFSFSEEDPFHPLVICISPKKCKFTFVLSSVHFSALSDVTNTPTDTEIRLMEQKLIDLGGSKEIIDSLRIVSSTLGTAESLSRIASTRAIAEIMTLTPPHSSSGTPTYGTL
jgi:hypothetical protein